MTILGLECSAVAASCAITRDGVLLCEAFSAVRLTHSQTLLPMMEDMLRNARLTLQDVDLLAVSRGPGSFTGLRIGIAAVKGMAQALGKPVAGVSTLEGMAHGYGGDGILVPVMDARCNQTYTAAFRGTERIWEDMAIEIPALGERIRALNEPVTLIGDGAEMVYKQLAEQLPVRLAPACRRLQRASGVCFAAERAEAVAPEKLEPTYLRLSQAERMANRKNAAADG